MVGGQTGGVVLTHEPGKPAEGLGYTHEQVKRNIKRRYRRKSDWRTRGTQGPITYEEYKTTTPLQPPPEPEVIQKDVTLREDQWIRIKWEKPTGEIVTSTVEAKYLKSKFKDRHIISISTLQGDVFYKAPSSSEWSETMTGYYQKQYRETGYIPFDFYRDIEKNIPKDVKFLGLEKEYIHASYREGINFYDTGLIGPSLSPSLSFEKTYETAFEKLPPSKKFEYGISFGDIKEKPMLKWKHYEGGLEYLKGHKEESIKQYVEQKGGWENIKMDLYKYASKGGIWSGKKPRDPSLLKEHAWEKLTLTTGQRREKYFSVLPGPVKWYSSGFHATVSATLFPVTLTQMGVKYIRGEGSPFDPLGRIKTGRTFGPDVSAGLSMVSPGGPSGIISTGISEGIAKISDGESDLWEKFQKYPISGGFATVGEVFGLYMGGKILHVGKVGTIRGLGHIRRGVVSRTGWNLPTYATYMKYRPSNILRHVWWKGKEKLGRAEYIPEEKVWDVGVLSGGKKFAELSGAGRQFRLFESTRQLTRSGEIAAIHTAGHRFPFITKTFGLSESPGLSVSAFGRGSPHFLRVTGTNLSYSTSGMSLFPRMGLPTGPIFYLKKVFRLPRNVLKLKKGDLTPTVTRPYSGGFYYYRTGEFMLKQPRGQYGWIAPKVELGGPEIEAKIVNVWARRTSSYYYTTYKGSIVPLPEYGIIQKGMPMGFDIGSKISSNVKQFFSISSSGGPPSIPIIRPGYILSSMGSMKYSTGSYIPSSIISSKISSISSSKGSSISSSILSSIRSPSINYIPSKPSSPSYPSFPSIPSIPSYPGSSKPSSPSSPSYPSFPSPPGPKILYYFPGGGKRRKQKRPKNIFDVGYKFRLHDVGYKKYVSPFKKI